MKLKKICLLLILSLCVLFAVGCNDKNPYEGQVKVTYCLQGGSFNNSSEDVVYYFDFKNDNPEGHTILDPETFCKKSNIKPIISYELNTSKIEYHIEGWYLEPEYTNKFDFTKPIKEKEITLYAKWEKNIQYSFNIYYKNSNGENVLLDTIVKYEDAMLDVHANNYTFTKVTNLDGTPYDMNTKLTTQQNEVSVLVEYLEGNYKFVSSLKDLTSVGSKENIYLTDDIDCNGETLDLSNIVNKKVLIGNGHTISNFVVDSKKHNSRNNLQGPDNNWCTISLFGDLQNATVSNVNFSNVTCSIDAGYSEIKEVKLCCLCAFASGCKFENVTFNGTYDITKLNKTITEYDITIVEFAIDGENEFKNCTSEYTKINKTN